MSIILLTNNIIWVL